jgi:hypothetical protein
MEGKCIQGFVSKSDGKRPLGSPRYRFADSIIMDLKK